MSIALDMRDPAARSSAQEPIELGTLLDVNGTVGRAATSVFIYDTGTLHAGPALYIPPPYPQYVKTRVFILLCSDTIDPARLAQHRRDNGLVGRDDVRIPLPTGTAAASAAAASAAATTSTSTFAP